MACITMFAPKAMATTQVMRVIRCECADSQWNGSTDRTPLSMNWVVVSDGDGRRVLRAWCERDQDC
jgi:hypothetical protein